MFHTWKTNNQHHVFLFLGVICTLFWSSSHISSVNLYKLHPLCRRPHPIFLHIAGWRLPVPVLHRDAPGGTVVCHYIVKCFTGNTNFQLQELRPAERKTWEDVSEGKINRKKISEIPFLNKKIMKYHLKKGNEWDYLNFLPLFACVPPFHTMSVPSS